ncbi:MAG TPA: NUDIX hydrolase [Oligoflexia bacterium]|nr:NUDIX hydrolase [Oligoflexia bacterium]HMP26453.1 NUDIX hydrolase [Oligoflexia bacterium]
MSIKNPWQTLSSKVIYQNRWIKLREDQVIQPKGAPGIYSVLEIPPAVAIVALDESWKVCLVGQWRYTQNKFSWEIPGGSSEKTIGSILENAKRELLEETGISAEIWEPLGTIDNSNGATNDTAHLFLARSLKVGKPAFEETEDIQIKWIHFDEAIDLVFKDQISESCSVACLLKAKIFLDSKRRS